jgi:hypothetical protein
MTASMRWSELLTCPTCGQSGVVHLSQPEGRAYDVDIDAVPAGFKVANHGFAEAFFCSDCDRPVETN